MYVIWHLEPVKKADGKPMLTPAWLTVSWSQTFTLCSSLFSVAVVKCSDEKQLGREELFNSLFRSQSITAKKAQ